MNDTRFPSAIHMLILISEAQAPMTSEQIAESVGTNASHIRKLAGMLKAHGIIDSGRGRAGFHLMEEPENVTLQAVYEAIHGAGQVHIFDLHQNPSDECVVGRRIRPMLRDVFAKAEAEATRALRETTLADCIQEMKAMVESGDR